MIFTIFKHFLLYKIYATLYWTYKYIKDYSYIADSFYSNGFLLILEKYLNKQFKKDWLGRLYGIINPYIDINGKTDFSNSIIEFNDNYTNSTEYVKVWITKQMNLVNTVFSLKKSNFFDYIGLEVKSIGDPTYDNFLIIFDIVSRKEMAIWFKQMLIHLLIYCIIIFIILLII